ncbi:MAG: pentapeptide repeat-containing protein [Ktedonobacteraceae bacterium]|nr:pentapeptide repeat-containing protein [Ktedonobacteraceae bacterium]
MLEQNHASIPMQPAPIHREDWSTYWQKVGQAWRTEPEIDGERQAYLKQRLSIQPDLEAGIYPFKDSKLDRADVEWLLTNHGDGRGPVNWRDPSQRDRLGLDLRGADLRGANLRGLPLSHMLGGLTWRERDRTPERREMAAVHLEGAILSETHLERAELYMAYLSRADLYMAHLENASLRKAHFEGASLRKAYLAYAGGQELEMRGAKLLPADLRACFFDSATDLRSAYLGDKRHGYVRLADVQWGGVNLAIIDWDPIKILGDEGKARKVHHTGEDAHEAHIADYREAVRANRQLSVALQGQGLNEEATRFSYRAQLLQRQVLKYQRRPLAYLFSHFLDLLAGYGYKPARSIISYILVILITAAVYFVLGEIFGPRFSPLGALVFSLTSFHGRGFFPGGIPLDDPITVAAALEAIVGLTIEISFIATFTQRFFGK